MLFTTLDDYIKANGMIKEMPAEKIAADLVETGKANYKKAKEFFREILDYRRDIEILKAAKNIQTPDRLLKSRTSLFEDCARKIVNTAIIFDDMTCAPLMDKDMWEEFKWSAEDAVGEEWCIAVLNTLIDRGYNPDDIFERKFADEYTRDYRLKEIGKICKRHTSESIIDKKHKLEELGSKYQTNILSTLTRGELQCFLDDDRLFGCHMGIISLEKEPLINVTDEEMEAYLEDSKYGPFLKDLRSNFDFLTKKKLVKVQDQYTDEELNELVFEDLAVTNLRIKNIIQILQEPDLAQRNKWLREIKRMPLTDDEKVAAIRGDYTTANARINKAFFEIELQTRRDFYESIGINYENYDINANLPQVKYGIEIEENGVEYYYNTHGFQGHSDYSISSYSKRTHEYDTKISGEYVSEIFKSDDKKRMKQLRTQADLLGYYGADTNTSCGFHVHCSDDHIRDALTERKALYNYAEYLNYLDEAKENGGSLFYYGINKEFQNMQYVVAKKLHVFHERSYGYCEFLDEEEPVPDMEKREKFINFCSLDKHGSIEFRFLNLPDAIDPKVMEAYIDFCTCYYSYLTEENFTEDYAKTAYEEMTGRSFEELSKEEYENLKFDILLEQLCVTDDTKKVITHLDDIFRFYNVQNENGTDYDFYTQYDQTITEENINKQIIDIVSEMANDEIEEEYEDFDEEDYRAI